MINICIYTPGNVTRITLKVIIIDALNEEPDLENLVTETNLQSVSMI